MNIDTELFDRVGFHWDRAKVSTNYPTHSEERVCFRYQRMLPEFVWDAAVLEGNPFTYPEVKTLMDGITVGGKKLSDQDQILNLIESSKLLLSMVKGNRFIVDKPIFCELHNIIGRDEAMEWGHFRGEGAETNYTPDVGLGEHGRYTPLPTVKGAPELSKTFHKALESMNKHLPNPFEKAQIFFLHGALQQYFFDGNKRTSRAMMNGILMTHGIDAISIPAAKKQEFNEKIIQFYLTKDATKMVEFLSNLLPDIAPPKPPVHRSMGRK